MAHDIRVWAKPEKGEHYAIGGDPAEGLQRGDDSVLEVLNVSTGEQVCEVQGKIEPVAFGEMANALGLWYNTALIGIENNKDLTPINVLSRGLNYPNLYLQATDRAKGFDEQTQKIGWNTNHMSRTRIVNQGRQGLRDGNLKVYSSQLIGQWETFALEGTKYQAIAGAHDDLVMAWLIAVEMMMVVLSGLHVEEHGLNALWEGGEVSEAGVWDEEEQLGLVDRHIKQVRDKQEKEVIEYSSWGNLV